MHLQSFFNSSEGQTRDITGIDNPQTVGRRGFVKGAVAGIGIASIGMEIRDQTAAEASAARIPHSDGTLRAITWTDENSAIGAVAVGTDEVRVLPMFAKTDQLQPSGDDIARISVGTGPIAIGILPNTERSILLARTSLETVDQYSVSFDLDTNMRQYFLDQRLSLDGYRTAGTYIFDNNQVVPEPILIDSKGKVSSNSILQTLWKDRLSGANYEPISINYLADRWYIFLTGSGIYGLETTISEEIIALELSNTDASIQDIHSISKIDGHFGTGYKSIELDQSKIAFVSTDTTGRIQVISLDMADRVTKQNNYSLLDRPLLNRLLQHDRLSGSGHKDSWIAEVAPGTYIVETLGEETL